MRKAVIATVLSSVIGITSLNAADIAVRGASAQINSVSSTHSISKSDVDFLFNNADTSKVVALSSDEMSETKGQFWKFFLAAVGVNAVTKFLGRLFGF